MAGRILPFPYPLKLGTDICNISRIYNILASPRGPRFIDRVLAPEERQQGKLAHPVARFLLDRDRGRRSGAQNANTGAQSRRANTTRGEDGPGALAPGLDASGGKNTKHRDTNPPNPQPSESSYLWAAAQFMAGRFAAKEAAIKAHPHLGASFHSVVIARAGARTDGLGSGPPVAIVRGREGRLRQEALVSISHDGEYATAVCIGFVAG